MLVRRCGCTGVERCYSCRMGINVPDRQLGSSIPLGKSTVITGSEALRHRASLMLENTTFLPRLPDYVHVRDSATLMTSAHSKTEAVRYNNRPSYFTPNRRGLFAKQHVQNLWSLLNPNGGVLILLEKGGKEDSKLLLELVSCSLNDTSQALHPRNTNLLLNRR